MKTDIQHVLQKNDWMTARVPATPAKVLCRPDCPDCGGVGYLRYDVPFGHPLFGKLAPCPNLPANSSIFSGHGLSAEEIGSLSWQGIKNRENVTEAVNAVKGLFERGTGMGYLFGGVGLAKTLLLKTMCAEWYRGQRGMFHYTTVTDILEDLRLAFDDDEPQRALRDKEAKYLSHPLLAIDELGAERKTEFGIEKFFALVNRRHEAGTEHGDGLVTIMAGNVSPNELDFRIADRLTDGRNFIVRLSGESFRPAMKW